MTQSFRGLRIAGAMAAVLCPASAQAQAPAAQLPCGTRAEIVDILQNTYGEHRIGHGRAYTGATAEIFTGPNGTWSIVATAPDGRSCLIGAGNAWTATDSTVGDEI